MPCHDDTPAKHHADTMTQRALKIDLLTQLLCVAGKCFKYDAPPPPDLLKWWALHEKADARNGRPWKESDVDNYSLRCRHDKDPYECDFCSDYIKDNGRDGLAPYSPFKADRWKP